MLEEKDLENFIDFYILTENSDLDFNNKIARLNKYFMDVEWNTEEYLCMSYYLKMHLILKKIDHKLITSFIELIGEGYRD